MKCSEIFAALEMLEKERGISDTYFVLADFRAYVQAQERVMQAYKDERQWAKSAILNVANVGKFSSDRTIEEYVRDIWHLRKVYVEMEDEI